MDDWVLCSDRPPDSYERYLVTKETYIQGMYKYTYVDVEKFTPLRWDTNERVVAWKPLPKPYKEKKNG